MMSPISKNVKFVGGKKYNDNYLLGRREGSCSMNIEFPFYKVKNV